MSPTSEHPEQICPTTAGHCSGCGYPEGTFACKIRHVQLNTGDAKAARD